MNGEIKIVLLMQLLKIFMTLNDFSSATFSENQQLFCQTTQMRGVIYIRQGAWRRGNNWSSQKKRGDLPFYRISLLQLAMPGVRLLLDLLNHLYHNDSSPHAKSETKPWSGAVLLWQSEMDY